MRSAIAVAAEAAAIDVLCGSAVSWTNLRSVLRHCQRFARLWETCVLERRARCPQWPLPGRDRVAVGRRPLKSEHPLR